MWERKLQVDGNALYIQQSPFRRPLSTSFSSLEMVFADLYQCRLLPTALLPRLPCCRRCCACLLPSLSFRRWRLQLLHRLPVNLFFNLMHRLPKVAPVTLSNLLNLLPSKSSISTRRSGNWYVSLQTAWCVRHLSCRRTHVLQHTLASAYSCTQPHVSRNQSGSRRCQSIVRQHQRV